MYKYKVQDKEDPGTNKTSVTWELKTLKYKYNLLYKYKIHKNKNTRIGKVQMYLSDRELKPCNPVFSSFRCELYKEGKSLPDERDAVVIVTNVVLYLKFASWMMYQS